MTTQTTAKQPTSFRFTADELELIDALVAHLDHRTGIPHSRSDAIRSLLKRATPPDGQGSVEARLRRAYSGVFG